MIKKITIIFLFSCISAQVQYDPNTGEPLTGKFDPNTGEQIEQKFDPSTGKPLEKKKEGMTAKVTLTTGDIIQGKLVIQDQEKIVVASKMVGTVTIDRANIKSISLGGVPLSSRRANSSPAMSGVSTNNPSNNKLFNSEAIASRALGEANIKNNKSLNTAIGTGACAIVPFISLPVMAIAIVGDVGIPEPDSEFYYALDSESKKIYKDKYKKETRKLRTRQCFTPTLLVGAAFVFIIFQGF